MDTRKFAYRRAEAPKGGPDLIFATPLLNRRLVIATPEFLARVKAYVLDLMTRDKGLKLSNFGAWHSTGDLFETKDETMTQLAGSLLGSAAEMSYFLVRDSHPDCTVEVAFHGGAWANVSHHADFNKPHIHPGAMWSGVFYVDLGDRDPEPDDNGAIEFMDPRPAYLNGTTRVLRPSAGQVVVFPSWLSHFVNPFRGRGERISIAFNANAKITAPSKAE
jgi:uncharacterized protein (TIGR02466 family)